MNYPKALVLNANGTVIADPMEDEIFRGVYAEMYGKEEIERFDFADPSMRYRKETVMQKLKMQDRLYPHVTELLEACRDSGFDLIAFAGASQERLMEKFSELGIQLNSAYSAHSVNRSDPSVYRVIGGIMKGSGYNPLAYLTQKPKQALASASAWGRALLCRDKETGRKGNIYTFDWESLTEAEILRIMEFLKEETV